MVFFAAPCLVALAPFLGAAIVFAQAQPLSLYVATDGDDAWSGRIAKRNNARTDGPFASLERARNEIRKIKMNEALPPGGVTVYVRGGTYYRTETFNLGQLDSGTEESPIIYRSYEHETPILVGGKPIAGFTLHKGSIVKTDVAKQGFKGIYFRQLFFNGKRQILARYPNIDSNKPYTTGFAYVAGEPRNIYKNIQAESLRVIKCKDTDKRFWANPEDGEVDIFPRFNFHNWVIPISSVNWAQHTITLQDDAFKGIRPQDRYYVRNLLEELDSPGEWYLDRKTWTLYFWPPGTLKNSTVYAPMIENLIWIGRNAKWISILGFSLQCSEGNGVLLDNAENCLVAGNTIKNIGGRIGYTAGVTVNNGKQCSVIGNDIYDVNNYGIQLVGGNVNTLEPANHNAENNYIHHVGELNGHGCGIVLNGVGHHVSHNLIHDTARCGIFGGGNDSVVEYNHIRHVGLMTEDTAGYYVNGNWQTRGLFVRYNYIHDVLGFGRNKSGQWVSPYFAWGIYLDDNYSGATVFGNIVVRTDQGGAFIHCGRDNLIENNVFVDGTVQQMTYSGYTENDPLILTQFGEFRKFKDKPAYAKYPGINKLTPETAWQMVGNKFRRNIIAYSNPKAKLYTYTRNNFPNQNESDYNLIWHFGLPLYLDLPEVPSKQHWKEWKKRGFDTHSIIADPYFVNPKADDYRLKDNSPAFKLGFQPIPTEKIGPYSS
ncbi:MAG: right-handed parallel beta-helix repeat-containing protein, partial [Petrimonas sp.]|nr:right-handed parallel beta-helix repeat-containing protein [Petrimonas sp.]